jgi:hypothetical protein
MPYDQKTTELCSRLALETWRSSGARTELRLCDLADHYATVYGQPNGNVRDAALRKRFTWELDPLTPGI